MSIADLINALIQWIADIVPFSVVASYQQGVRMTLGKVQTDKDGKCVVLSPGLRWKLPFIQEIHVSDTTSAAYQGWTQTITTADGVNLTLSGVVQLRVFNLGLLFVTIHDLDDVIQAQLAGAITEVVGNLEWETLEESPTEYITRSVQEILDAKFTAYGLELEEVLLQTLVEARTYRLINEPG